MLPAPHLKYLAGYPAHLVTQVGEVLARGELGDILRDKYPRPHGVRNDGALYDFVGS